MRIMKKVYEEPKLEIVNFNMKEELMNDGGEIMPYLASGGFPWGEEPTE